MSPNSYRSLSEDDKLHLRDLIVNCFSDSYSLDTAVRRGTGDRLFVDYVGEGFPQKKIVGKLLDALEDAGSTVFFLRGAIAQRPRRNDLRALFHELYPNVSAELPGERAFSVQQRGLPVELPPGAVLPGLEGNVRKKLQIQDVRIWVNMLERRECCVCRIERNGLGLGTGFLVGPDAVLTNWHVVNKAVANGTLAEIICRFDYARLVAGGNNAGVVVPLHADGCVDHSPFAPAEDTKTPEDPPPTPDQLDYALLRLARPVGQQALMAGGRAARLDRLALDSAAP